MPTTGCSQSRDWEDWDAQDTSCQQSQVAPLWSPPQRGKHLPLLLAGGEEDGAGRGTWDSTYPATPWSGTLRKSMLCSDGGRALGWWLALRGGRAVAGGPRVCFWGIL